MSNKSSPTFCRSSDHCASLALQYEDRIEVILQDIHQSTRARPHHSYATIVSNQHVAKEFRRSREHVGGEQAERPDQLGTEEPSEERRLLSRRLQILVIQPSSGTVPEYQTFNPPSHMAWLDTREVLQKFVDHLNGCWKSL